MSDEERKNWWKKDPPDLSQFKTFYKNNKGDIKSMTKSSWTERRDKALKEIYSPEEDLGAGFIDGSDWAKADADIRIKELEALVDHLKNGTSYRILELESTLAEAVNVIRFYADKENWYDPTFSPYLDRKMGVKEDCDSTGGKRAREFLKQIEDKNEP